MKNLTCPYCDKSIEDPDDCHSAETTYEHQCPECEKNFVFTLDYSVTYYEEKADCLNGADHDWKTPSGYPKGYFQNKRRCSMCDASKTLKEGDQGFTVVKKEDL